MQNLSLKLFTRTITTKEGELYSCIRQDKDQFYHYAVQATADRGPGQYVYYNAAGQTFDVLDAFFYELQDQKDLVKGEFYLVDDALLRFVTLVTGTNIAIFRNFEGGLVEYVTNFSNRRYMHVVASNFITNPGPRPKRLFDEWPELYGSNKPIQVGKALPINNLQLQYCQLDMPTD